MATVVSCRNFDQFKDTDAGAVEITGPCAPNCPKVDMATVPAGDFQMGCNANFDDECADHERPLHKVTLKEYLIDRYEVTIADYTKCVDAGECMPPNAGGNECRYGTEGSGQYPVNCIVWAYADHYCKWVGKRLPTEAEWEKAARGTEGWKFPWTETGTADCDHAMMAVEADGGSVNGCGTGYTAAVGSRPKGVSAFSGCLDMSGNVGEWVSDWYGENYFASSPSSDPPGPASGTQKMLKGGSYYDLSSTVRASFRFNTDPSDTSPFTGFRCAWSQ